PPQVNDLTTLDNTDAALNTEKEDSSWILESNPESTISTQADIFSENNITSNEGFSSGDILDNATSSSTAFDGSVFEVPSTTEISLSNAQSVPQQTAEQPSLGVFVMESVSPLQAITKKREEDIAVKDAEEKRKIDELRQQAKSDLERWYKDRQQQLEQHRQTTRTDEEDLRAKALEKSTKDTCDWSKVIRLLEFNDGTQLSKSKRDLTRMKSCMLIARRANENKKVSNGVQ
ncbi:unnamed protein product, partial [Adineta ricciae]